VVVAPRLGLFPRRGIILMDANTINTWDIAYSDPLPSDDVDSAITSNEVQLTVTLPDANARLWIQNQPVDGVGTERTFSSPPLEPGKLFAYTIRTAWVQDGREFSDEKTIYVTAGQNFIADFATHPVAVDNRMLAYKDDRILESGQAPKE
jgi:uncharacterized protein (TIGR03000 family)